MQRPCSSKRTFQENGTSLLVYTYGQSPTLTARYRDYLTAQPKILQIVQGQVPSTEKTLYFDWRLAQVSRCKSCVLLLFGFLLRYCIMQGHQPTKHHKSQVLQSSAKFCKVLPRASWLWMLLHTRTASRRLLIAPCLPEHAGAYCRLQHDTASVFLSALIGPCRVGELSRDKLTRWNLN